MDDLKLVLKRFYNSRGGTLGKLYLQDEFVAYTLEPSNLDGMRNHAIPVGRYEFALSYSAKFHRILPLLSVPKRSGILIHNGNLSRHTRGCILVGYTYKLDPVSVCDSLACLDYLVTSLQHCRGCRFIDVINEPFKQLEFQYE